jgi:hypothetical protein
MLARVKPGRIPISPAAEENYLADVALASTFDELLSRAEAAEREYRQAQAASADVSVQYPLARTLDRALTAAMRAAFAARNAEIGPRGYEDRIFRRKAMATPAVHAWTDEAERLLTLREAHQLTGFPARPEAAVLGAQIAHVPAGSHQPEPAA